MLLWLTDKSSLSLSLSLDIDREGAGECKMEGVKRRVIYQLRLVNNRETLHMYLNSRVSNISSPQTETSKILAHGLSGNEEELKLVESLVVQSCVVSPFLFRGPGSQVLMHHNTLMNQLRCMSNNTSVELNMENDGIRFNIGKQPPDKHGSLTNGNRKAKKFKRSKKAKLNELRFFRLKAKKKMKSPNPEVRIRYKLDKAKRKEEWLIEKLRKYEIAKGPIETHDPEILTEEEKFYLKRTGEKKKNYVPVGRRGVFGGVVLNMHLHWKKHETVKVVCKPCRPGQINEYADELSRLSKGIVIDIKPNNTIIFYRGKNYVQPMVMSPLDTLSKDKALEKYQFEQSLEHTSQFIEKLEKELEEYLEHLVRYKKEKSTKIEHRDCPLTA